MNAYVTGSTIRRLREARGLTQAGLAKLLDVSDKAVSKWETAKGFPRSHVVGTSVRRPGRFGDGAALR